MMENQKQEEPKHQHSSRQRQHCQRREATTPFMQPLSQSRRRRTTASSGISISGMSLHKFFTMGDVSLVSMTMTMTTMVMATLLLLCTASFSTCTAFQLKPTVSPTAKTPPPPPMMMMNTVPRRIGRRNEEVSSLVVLHLSKKQNNEEEVEDSSFVQRPGENDIDFIKRVTMESEQRLRKATKKHKNKINGANENEDEEGDDGKGPPKPATVGTVKYKPIEEWEEERQQRSKGGELTWEERVQFDGQRFGDQVRQQSILQKHIGTYWR
mmetsp:Transcript_4181/g.10374  ORF Transcript_4181/g.10374 Transcript_4181/m.10374 type:complete len:268 (-) Transcript_4181:1040-1843(-)